MKTVIQHAPETAGRAALNPKAIGECSEGIVLAELMKLGCAVLLPFGNNQRYDLVVDEGDSLIRVQVKTAWRANGAICFKTNSVNAFTGVRRTYVGQVDVFMVYSPHTELVYRIPIEECGSSTVSLRINPTRIASTCQTRWACDYELARHYQRRCGDTPPERTPEQDPAMLW